MFPGTYVCIFVPLSQHHSDPLYSQSLIVEIAVNWQLWLILLYGLQHLRSNLYPSNSGSTKPIFWKYNCLNKACLGPFLEGRKPQFCHSAAKNVVAQEITSYLYFNLIVKVYVQVGFYILGQLYFWWALSHKRTNLTFVGNFYKLNRIVKSFHVLKFKTNIWWDLVAYL